MCCRLAGARIARLRLTAVSICLRPSLQLRQACGGRDERRLERKGGDPPLFTEADLLVAEAELSSVCGASLSSALGQWPRLSAAARARRSGVGAELEDEEEARAVLSDLRLRRRAAVRRALRCVEEAEAAVAARAAAKRVCAALRHLDLAQRELQGLGAGAALRLARRSVIAADIQQGESSSGGERMESAKTLVADASRELRLWGDDNGVPSSALTAVDSWQSLPGPQGAIRRAMAEVEALRREQRVLVAAGVSAVPLHVSVDCARALNGLRRTADVDLAGSRGFEERVAGEAALVWLRLEAEFGPLGAEEEGEGRAASVAAAGALRPGGGEGESPAAKRLRSGPGAAAAPLARPVALFAAAAVAKVGLVSALEAVAVRCRKVQEIKSYLVRTQESFPSLCCC